MADVVTTIPEIPLWLRILAAFFRVFYPVFDFVSCAIFGFINAFKKRGVLPPITDDVLRLSATELAAKIRHKELQSADVVRSYIERLKTVQPLLNVYTDQRFDEALEEARKADELVDKTEDKEALANDKPFLGVPLTTKNAISVKGLHSDCGLVARKDIIAEEDAETIKKLRNAGFIVIAVTNVPELCLWAESYNNVHGRTNNPHDFRRSPGGSTGGDGSAVAAAGVPVGLGSDYGGSVRIPAFNCGVFSHKPSANLVMSHKGHVPITDDEPIPPLTQGPICRHVQDIAPFLQVLAGKDAEKYRLTEFVDVKKLNVFYLEDIGDPFICPLRSDQRSALKQAVAHLSKITGRQAQKISIKHLEYSSLLVHAQMKRELDLPNELGNLERQVNIPLECLKWLLRLSDHSLPALYMGVVIEYLMPAKTSPLMNLVEKMLKDITKSITDTLGDDGVLVLPTFPTPAGFHHQFAFQPMMIGYTAIFNHTGFPSTACPMGKNDNRLPLGVQVVSNHDNDRLSIAVAHELEKQFGGWVVP